MLSPGQFYKDVPKGLQENLDCRERLLKGCQLPQFRRAVMEMCRRDILFWINSFVWQFNPNTIGTASLEIGPFLTWDFQDGFFLDGDEAKDGPGILWCIEHRRDLVLEKSREMGASWMCLLALDWLFLFHPWKKFLVISRDEESVDKPDEPDSLFWKLDFVHEHLPSWMCGHIVRRKRGFKHTRTNSTITGQSSTGKSGVGGRATCMFIDEFSQIREDYEVFQRTSSTTGCRIFNGTHLGLDTCFFEITDPSNVAGSYIKKRVIHWSQHPDKRKGLYRYNSEGGKVEIVDKSYKFGPDYDFVRDGSPHGGPYPNLRSPWYDNEYRRKIVKGSARGVAMDLDINPSGSVTQFFDPATIRILQEKFCEEARWQGRVELDPETRRVSKWIEDDKGAIKLWCLLRDGHGLPGRYGAGADLSWGTGRTNSCFSIINGETGEKVLEYVDPLVDPRLYAEYCTAILWCFCDKGGDPPLFAWELNGPGVGFGLRVMELGYRNVYIADTQEGNPFGSAARSERKAGWVPHGGGRGKHTKVLLLEDYREALAKRWVLNRSKIAMEECLAFQYSPRGDNVYHSGELNQVDPSAAGVNHGDRVIGDALAYKMVKGLVLETKKEPPPATVIGSLAWRRALHEQTRVRQEAWA
jgi:hypothetical protein